MNATFKILPRTDSSKKDGNYSIMLRLTLNRTQRTYFTLGISIPDPEKYWDPVSAQILKYPEADPVKWRESNQLLQKHALKARNIIFDHEINDKQLTSDEFRKLFLAKGDIKTSFYDFAENDIDEAERNRKHSSETIRSYRSYLSKLRQYRASLNFNEITIDFIKNYHGYMIKNLDNVPNTCHKSLSFIKTMLDKAKIAGIVKENVFRENKYKLSKNDGNREYLTENELYRLEQVFYNIPLHNYQMNVLRYFLFCCYCGLRYQDVKQLKHRDLIKRIHGQAETTIIKIKMHKTGKPIEIPVPKKALELIIPNDKNRSVFRVNANQTTNRYIKEITEICGIDKTISFHCSRHTYATISLSRGMDVWMLKDLMGHHDIKTTLVYAKIIPGDKITAVRNVWD